jgi:hypothetical protein
MRAVHHDAETTRTGTRAVGTTPSPWLAVRIILAVGAAVLLLLGTFSEWAGGTDGSNMAIQNLWEMHAGTSAFFSSAGLVTAVAGILIILGLAFSGGWLIRFGGAVALVAFTLVVIQLGRSGSLDTTQDIGLGLWLILAGGVLALIAGFFPAMRTVASTTAVENTDDDVEHEHSHT